MNVRNRFTAERLVGEVLAADVADIPRCLTNLKPYRAWANPRLEESLRQEIDQPKSSIALRASLALLPTQPQQIAYLTERLLIADPSELDLLIRELSRYSDRINEGYWSEVSDKKGNPDRRLRAACALASAAPTDQRWPTVAGDVASILMSQNSLSALSWSQRLEPVASFLVSPLMKIFEDQGRENQNDVLIAGEILVNYCQHDAERLAELLVKGDRHLFLRVIAHLSRCSNARECLAARLNPSHGVIWPDPPKQSSPLKLEDSKASEINSAGGFIDENFAWFLTMPETQASSMNQALQTAGYRPLRWHPYLSGSSVSVAAVYARDGIEGQLVMNLSLKQTQDQLMAWQEHGIYPVDIAGYLSQDGHTMFAAVGASLKERSTKFLLQVPENELSDRIRDMKQDGYVPLSAQRWNHENGTAVTNLILTKEIDSSRYLTLNSDGPLLGWEQSAPENFVYESAVIDVTTCAKSATNERETADIAEVKRLESAEEPEEIYRRALAQFRLQDFESAINGMTRLTDKSADGFWHPRLYSFEPGAMTYDTTHPRTGKSCLQLSAAIPNDVSAAQLVRIRPWSRYLLSGWIRTENVRIDQKGGRLAANLCVNYSGPESTASFEGTQDWRYATLIFHSRDRDRVEIRARIGHTGSTSTGKAWFDDISLVELAPDETNGLDQPEFLTTARQHRNLIYNGQCDSICPDPYEYLARSRIALAQWEKAAQTLTALEELQGNPTQILRVKSLAEYASGSSDQSLHKLDSFVKDSASDEADLYGAARTYAAIASQQTAQEVRKKLTEQSAGILSRLVARSAEWRETFALEGDFQRLIDNPRMANLISNPRDRNFCGVVIHHETGWESKFIRGELSPALRQQYLAYASKGYRPVAVSVVAQSGQSPESTMIWKIPKSSAEYRAEQNRQQAVALVGLIQLGFGANAWPSLSDFDNPERQSLTIQRIAAFGTPIDSMREQIRVTTDNSLLKVLILCLGQYDIAKIAAAQRDAIVKEISLIYRDHKDPGIHGAAAWCLTRWNQYAELTRQVDDLKQGHAVDQRRWYVTREGHTFSICEAKAFLMGSPADEKWHSSSEIQHWIRLDRTIAAATNLVTVEQFQRFARSQNLPLKPADRFTQQTDIPQASITWFEAAHYCNWLSELEGIPRDQWCYEPDDSGEYSSGMKLAANYLSRTGYRLPSEPEWEFLCRAGSKSSRYFGESNELLASHAWFSGNSNNHTRPVGRLIPNSFGLFDMLGNVFEWCQDPQVDYPENSQSIPPDIEQSLEIKAGTPRIIRGGSFNREAPTIRSAARTMDPPGYRSSSIGFRVVRTLP